MVGSKISHFFVPYCFERRDKGSNLRVFWHLHKTNPQQRFELCLRHFALRQINLCTDRKVAQLQLISCNKGCEGASELLRTVCDQITLSLFSCLVIETFCFSWLSTFW